MEKVELMKWEYKIVNFSGTKPIEDIFNDLGKDGWELVTIAGLAYFKRPIQEGRKETQVESLIKEIVTRPPK